MSKQKSKIDLIDNMSQHLKQSEALTTALMCADFHDPTNRELNGIFSILNDHIRKVQKTIEQYIESHEVENAKIST